MLTPLGLIGQEAYVRPSLNHGIVSVTGGFDAHEVNGTIQPGGYFASKNNRDATRPNCVPLGQDRVSQINRRTQHSTWDQRIHQLRSRHFDSHESFLSTTNIDKLFTGK
jgi:hypothetical protein